MKNAAKELTENDPWTRFAMVAEEYCQLIEDDSVRGRQGLYVIRQALLKLYSVAIELPATTGSIKVPERIGLDGWRLMYKALEERFKEDTIYWDASNPLEQSTEDPMTNSLADDLADIWLDIKAGLGVGSYATAKEIRGARWDCKFNFEIHWGAHAIGALRALHYILLQDS